MRRESAARKLARLAQVDKIAPIAHNQGSALSQYGRMRLILVRRIFRGLDNAELLRARRGQSRIRLWRISHA